LWSVEPAGPTRQSDQQSTIHGATSIAEGLIVAQLRNPKSQSFEK
jgi:hypothetical protein